MLLNEKLGWMRLVMIPFSAFGPEMLRKFSSWNSSRDTSLNV